MFHKKSAHAFLLTMLALLVFATSAIAKNLFTEDEEDFLPADQAFKLVLTSVAADGLAADFVVAPGYYLYKDRIKFELQSPKEASISSVVLPAGEEKNDPNFGKMQVYHHDFSAQIKLANVAGNSVTVKAVYQGCSEKGLCYPPQRKTYTLTLDEAAKNAVVKLAQPSAVSQPAQTSDGLAADTLKSGKWWLIILGFFTAGLLLSFTPCVFPMIPILSSIIVGKNAHHTRWHAFTLSLAYTLGMALTYTLAGIAAGLSGQLLSNALQTPLALGFGALIFVLLALSMFGFYELKLPSAIENRFFNWSNRFKGGHLFGDFLMGAISALIISPCVAAPLAGALLYISKTHDVVLGGIALFSLSLGMGVPLLLIGASAGTLLPKVGAWMNAVRNLFGVLMLGVAVWLIAPVIPMSIQMVLWAALLIVPAIFMRAVDSLPTDTQPIQRLWKGIGIIMLVAGIALLVGALSGAKSPLQPLNGLLATSGQAQTAHSLNFKRVKTVAELESTLQAAQGKPVMLDFYADWCVTCKEWDQFTFSDPRVQAALKEVTLLQVDVTENTADDAALLKKFNLFGPPGIILFNFSKASPMATVTGYENAETFLKTMDKHRSCLSPSIQC